MRYNRFKTLFLRGKITKLYQNPVNPMIYGVFAFHLEPKYSNSRSLKGANATPKNIFKIWVSRNPKNHC